LIELDFRSKYSDCGYSKRSEIFFCC